MLRNIVLALLLLLPGTAQAADLSGLWQGTTTYTRYLRISRNRDGGYRGEMFYPGDAGGNNENGNSISAIVVSGPAIGFQFDKSKGSFKGTISADGNSMSGSWQGESRASPFTFTRAPRDTVIDASPHTTHMIAVDKDVTLEVLDWGGSGPPLVLLAGLSDDAHIFDSFALRFTARHHVYAITRRGTGISSIPTPTAQNYDANRLGDDVVAVLDALKLQHPVLAGHSIAGEELSAVGINHPGRTAALIYLDAGYGYALYAPGGQIGFGTNLTIESKAVEARLDRLRSVARDPKALPAAIADVEKALPDLQADLAGMTQTLAAGGAIFVPPPDDSLSGKVCDAILDGARRYDHVDGPILALFALPAEPAGLPAGMKPAFQRLAEVTAAHADAFARANPQADVVRLAGVQHDLYKSDPDQVARQMNAFMDALH
jgi:non-heme chloroperoxidase